MFQIGSNESLPILIISQKGVAKNRTNIDRYFEVELFELPNLFYFLGGQMRGLTPYGIVI